MFYTRSLADPFSTLDHFIFNSTVKDMAPYAAYKKDNSIIYEIKTLGINPDDISVTLTDQNLKVKGETISKVSGQSFTVDYNFRLDDKIFNNLKSVSYKSQNGLTYITLKQKESKKTAIPINKE